MKRKKHLPKTPQAAFAEETEVMPAESVRLKRNDIDFPILINDVISLCYNETDACLKEDYNEIYTIRTT